MQGDDHWWRNVEGHRFVEETDKLFPKTPWGAMGVGFFDWNNDQRLDLLVTDMHSDMHGQEVHLLRDEKRKYEVPLPGSQNNVQGNAFWEQQPDGSFVEISDRVGLRTTGRGGSPSATSTPTDGRTSSSLRA